MRLLIVLIWVLYGSVHIHNNGEQKETYRSAERTNSHLHTHTHTHTHTRTHTHSSSKCSRMFTDMNKQFQHCKLVLGTWNIASLAGKEPELMCEVERHQLDIVGLTSTYSMGSGGWTLSYLLTFWSCPVGEVLGSCGDTHKPPVEWLSVGVLSSELPVDSLQLQVAGRKVLTVVYHQSARQTPVREMFNSYLGENFSTRGVWAVEYVPTIRPSLSQTYWGSHRSLTILCTCVLWTWRRFIVVSPEGSCGGAAGVQGSRVAFAHYLVPER